MGDEAGGEAEFHTELADVLVTVDSVLAEFFGGPVGEGLGEVRDRAVKAAGHEFGDEAADGAGGGEGGVEAHRQRDGHDGAHGRGLGDLEPAGTRTRCRNSSYK